MSGCGGATEEPGWVAGVDGCPAGWVAVLLPLSDGATPRVHAAATFTEILALAEAPVRIAVDMPIGLAERVGPGGRICDVEARRRLGQRQSSVFTVPARAAVMEADYRRACAVALAASEPPRQVSKQCFNLFAKIREIDAHVDPERQTRIFECHPELAYWAMNGGRSLDLPKKVKSRAFEPGLELRRSLLAEGGVPRSAIDRMHPWPGVGADDLLDAMACAWTARRVHRGEAIRLPQSPPLDARGLRMEVWA